MKSRCHSLRFVYTQKRKVNVCNFLDIRWIRRGNPQLRDCSDSISNDRKGHCYDNGGRTRMYKYIVNICCNFDLEQVKHADFSISM